MRKHLTAAVTAATAAVLASGTGLAIAATHHAAPARPAAVSGTEHFQLMTTNGASNRDVLIATGVFTAGGVDISGKGNTDLVQLPGGTFRLTHHQVHFSQHFNPKTCYGEFSGPAVYKISHGTGRYAGLRGSGTATVSGSMIGSRNSHGRCTPNGKPQEFELIIKASGPVSLP